MGPCLRAQQPLRSFLALSQGWAEARACLQKTYGREGAGLLLLLLPRSSGNENRPCPPAQPSLRTKSEPADKLRPHEGLLRLTASGSAAEPRPHAGARLQTSCVRAGRARTRGPAWLCDGLLVAPPLPAASADPSGFVGEQRPRALAQPGPAALGLPPAPAAAGLLPPLLPVPPGTAASAPAQEERARGDIRAGHAHRTGPFYLHLRDHWPLSLQALRVTALSISPAPDCFVGSPLSHLTLLSWASLSAPAWRSERAARALFTAAAQCSAVFPRGRRGRLLPLLGARRLGSCFPRVLSLGEGLFGPVGPSKAGSVAQETTGLQEVLPW